MEKITLSSAAPAAVMAMMVLQGCAGGTGTTVTPATQCAKPTLTPSEAGHAITSVGVMVATATPEAYLRYTLDSSTPTGGPSGNGTQIPARKGKVRVNFGPRGTTLRVIAYKAGLADSPIAEGNYFYQSPY